MSAIPADPADVRRLVVERIAHWSGVPEADIAVDRPLAELGMSSRDAVVIAAELSHALGRELPPTLLWETSTVDGLVALLGESLEPVPETAFVPGRSPSTTTNRSPWSASAVASPAVCEDPATTGGCSSRAPMP